MRALLAGLLALLSVGSAVAEPIPADVIETMRSSCIRAHGHKPGGPVYCTCMAVETAKNLSLQQLATIEGEIAAAVRRGTNPQQASAGISEFQAIERTCQRAAAQRP